MEIDMLGVGRDAMFAHIMTHWVRHRDMNDEWWHDLVPQI